MIHNASTSAAKRIYEALGLLGSAHITRQIAKRGAFAGSLDTCKTPTTLHRSRFYASASRRRPQAVVRSRSESDVIF